MTESGYPLEIIPRMHYPGKISWSHILNKNKRFYVCRRIERPLSDCVTNLAGGVKELDPDCLGQHIVKMSMNLLGGCFNEEHLVFRTLKEASKPWLSEDIDFDLYRNNVENLGSAYPLYYSSEDIHRKNYPIELNFEKKDKDKYNALRNSVRTLCLDVFKGMDTDVSMECTLFISHEPTKLNYWHVQLDVKPSLEDDSKSFKNDNSFRKDIYTQLVCDILCKKFIEEVDHIDPLPPCSYCRLTKKCQYI